MLEAKNRHIKRIRNLVFVSSLSTIILIVSTFAWFVGMRSVSVSSFDVEIATTESLLLSFDGATWSHNVSISKATLDAISYANHTNSWGGHGLIPMSSVGEMDINASRMVLFEKASFTPSPGGYRLIASRVNNFETGNPEQDGYVAFDLFIRNFTGTQYLEELNPKNEEAIYLTTDSKVEVASGGIANTGIENSVRVAFAQIGRVIGTSGDTAKITGISCVPIADPDNQGKMITGIESGVTGICRTAQIWEPNDRDHVDAAISYYDVSCLKRKAKDEGGGDVTDPAAYSSDKCNMVADGTSYDTYAVKVPITYDYNVNVYDGADYNTYADSITKGYLYAYPYFTDEMKERTGTKRPAFMTLAPNSITKVRIYIYLEGQDVDNYDFASIGKRIAVNFGFTKERFVEDDIDYEGPDLEEPVITLEGDNPLILVQGADYVEPGYTVTDNVIYEDDEEEYNITEDDVSVKIGNFDKDVPGTYYIEYSVTDHAGNTGVNTRVVVVVPSE